jgi:DNA-binding response OmpR family regulator
MTDQIKKKIVYIEDDPELVTLVAMILEQHGFEVFGATDGRQGLELVLDKKPDLVLLDLMIPELSGWDVYKQLEADKITRDIPVIVITAKSQPIDKVVGLHVAKVDDYLCKPFIPSQLIASIEKVMKLE